MKTTIHTLDDTARAAGVSYSRLKYHITLGNLPAPESWNGSGRKVYTDEGVEAVRRFFANRTLWQRTVQSISKGSD